MNYLGDGTMIKHKKNGFIDAIKSGLSSVFQIISASIFPSMTESLERVMENMEIMIVQMEKRILRKISSLLIIGFGGILLIFAIFFCLKDILGWSNAAAYFSIGIIVFVIGLLLKMRESNP